MASASGESASKTSAVTTGVSDAIASPQRRPARARPPVRAHDHRRPRILHADADADAVAARDARERAELLTHAVLADLEVVGREIRHRLALPIAHDDVDEHRRRHRLGGGSAAAVPTAVRLRGWLRLALIAG